MENKKFKKCTGKVVSHIVLLMNVDDRPDVLYIYVLGESKRFAAKIFTHNDQIYNI